MLLIVVDCESTGLDTTKDGVVEVACVPVQYIKEQWTTGNGKSSFVNPEIPIPPATSGTHHIIDSMVADAPVLHAAFLKVLVDIGVVDAQQITTVWCAHNAFFDRPLLERGGLDTSASWVCTLQCTRHLYPDFETHRLQSLRYMLGLKPNLPNDLAPHRALYDAIVCAELLVFLLKEHSVEELIELTNKPVLLPRVTFGKNRGQQWSSMDRGFLRWILDKDFGADVKYTAGHWLKVKYG